MNNLTEKQKRFIDYYIQTGNATESCRLAGYKGTNLDVIGNQNLVKLGIYIEPRLQELNTTRIAEMEQILEFWSQIMDDTNTRITDRLRASELLCKALGGFIDRKEVTVDSDWFKENPFDGLTTEELREIVKNDTL